MCSGASLLYKIPQIIVGENVTFRGPEEYLRSRGVKLSILGDERCVAMMKRMIAERPTLWFEDIGEPAR
jgi:creatinine deaminase